MNCCVRAAPALLLHVNIFLVLYAGAGLATGARLKWDPSTYVALREALPAEYRAAAVAIPAAAVALLLLVHFVVVALRTRRASLRRLLLLVYALIMALMMCGEAALAWWLRARAAAWARSAAAAELQHALALRDALRPLLEHLAHWHPLPTKLKAIMQEAEEDAPRNLYVCAAAALLLLLLQGGAVLLALLAAAAARPRPRLPRHARHSGHPRHLRRRSSSASTPLSATTDYEKPSMRAVYKNGRLMMV